MKNVTLCYFIAEMRVMRLLFRRNRKRRVYVSLKAEPWMAERANWRMDAPLSEKGTQNSPF
jgi:hypothetical protein